MITSQKPYGYWTKERCQEESLKYIYKIDFINNSGVVYNIVLKNNWIDELCSHMIEIKKPKGYWTYEKCKEESLKYTNKTDFFKNANSAYNTSIKNNWLDELCSQIPNGFWTKEKCQEESKKYNTRSEFNINSNVAYQKSRRKGWLNEICSHMKPVHDFKNSSYSSINFS